MEILPYSPDVVNLARDKVHQQGYNFAKGKSRSKRFASPPQDTPKPTRTKISSDVRQKRISALREDMANIDKQLTFKNKRHQQAETVRNYKMCEDITEEIKFVMKQNRELSEELTKLQEKDWRAKWYHKRKSLKGSAAIVTSDDSDCIQLSPGSSRTATSEVPITDHACIESNSDTEPQQSTSSVFPCGLPVDRL